MARVYDAEILPIWSHPFGRMLLRGIKLPTKAMVLDVGCATGYPSLEILQRMDPQGRIIAIDSMGPLLDIAREKAGELASKRIFFRTESLTAKLAFADEVYDLVVSNIGVPRIDNPRKAIQEFARVTKDRGQIIITLPIAGTYYEFFDIYREVLIKNDQHDILERLEYHISLLPEPDEVVCWFEDAQLSQLTVEVNEFMLLFKSSREFFFSPVMEFGPLGAWKEVAGKGKMMQEIFWHIKEAIDAYFKKRAFQLTVRAGCFRATKTLCKDSFKLLKVDEQNDLRETSPFAIGEIPEEEQLRDNFVLEEEDMD
jgi:ubiquinone/menaquinone biosynthesis C-methylase UbiE